MQRHSKKRQSILDCLRSTREHPSADWIYAQLKPVYPELSPATVYRNLRQLQKEGLIRSVGIVRGQERFDADLSPHAHAFCVRCGKMIDVDAQPETDVLPDGLTDRISRRTGFELHGVELQFSGLCPECRKKKAGGTDA